MRKFAFISFQQITMNVALRRGFSLCARGTDCSGSLLLAFFSHSNDSLMVSLNGNCYTLLSEWVRCISVSTLTVLTVIVDTEVAWEELEPLSVFEDNRKRKLIWMCESLPLRDALALYCRQFINKRASITTIADLERPKVPRTVHFCAGVCARALVTAVSAPFFRSIWAIIGKRLHSVCSALTRNENDGKCNRRQT